MNEENARFILGDAIKEDGSIHSYNPYINWRPGDTSICLDADFPILHLEAIVWWMKNKCVTK